MVHCQAGISRSASICLAYLLWSQTSKTLNEAFEFVRSRRPVVAPNFNFLRQLKEYEASLLSGRYLYHHHDQHPLILRSIQTPSSLPSEISYIHTPENSSGRENVFRFTFEQRQSSVFCDDKEDESSCCNDSEFHKFKQNVSFDGSQENVFIPPLLLPSKSGENYRQDVSEAPSRRKKLLKERKTFKARLLERLRKFSCPGCPLHGNSSDNPRWKKCMEKIKQTCAPETTIHVKIQRLSNNPCHHLGRDASCRPHREFLSTMFKALIGGRNDDQFSQSPCKRLVGQSSLMAHKILRHHHHHHHHHHHGHHHRHRCRQCHPCLKIRYNSHQKVVEPDMVLHDGGDGDDDVLGISVKVTFILIMVITLVFLVEKKYLL